VATIHRQDQGRGARDQPSSFLFHEVLLETLYIRREQHPVVGRSRPDMPVDLHPTGIIEGADTYAAITWNSFECECDVGSAARTKFQAQPAAALVGSMFVSAKRPAAYLHILVPEERRFGEGGAGAPLAKSAVTHVRSQRIAVHPISDCAAETASLVDLRHIVPFLLGPRKVRSATWRSAAPACGRRLQQQVMTHVTRDSHNSSAIVSTPLPTERLRTRYRFPVYWSVTSVVTDLCSG
jgi:hypothetical protein